jgi:hypothetical protein
MDGADSFDTGNRLTVFGGKSVCVLQVEEQERRCLCRLETPDFIMDASLLVRVPKSRFEKTLFCKSRSIIPRLSWSDTLITCWMYFPSPLVPNLLCVFGVNNLPYCIRIQAFDTIRICVCSVCFLHSSDLQILARVPFAR